MAIATHKQHTKAKPPEDEQARVLIVMANPDTGAPLDLDKEVREIEESLQGARRAFQTQVLNGASKLSLAQALRNFEPHIVHMGAHGQLDGIILQDRAGRPRRAGAEALAELFRWCTDTVQCVVMNACYSEGQADAIGQYIDCVVGMRYRVGDEAAIEFSRGFYDSLGSGQSFEEAFHIAKSVIPEEHIEDFRSPTMRLAESPETNQTESDAANSARANPSPTPKSETSGGGINISGGSLGDISLGNTTRTEHH